ncbi:MAG: succinyl-diaminopimelate desuccinylase [Legionellales bacterium]|nr:succinyl-diaminopimelate desuccinylase [Legionellales bacterium]|tara:strand:- start:42352 stop:43488 length:1137 start_codon:yes stop_codon:yes gene_type:complete
MSELLELCESLIKVPSITPHDHGAQDILLEQLIPLGFSVEKITFNGADNFWARLGNSGPLFVFAGHTDVVATGPEVEWHTPPFEPVVKDGFLHGRGAADMKGSLAAMIVATKQFLQDNKLFNGSVGFLITSAEEGPSHDGTPQVLKFLEQSKQQIDYCLVGEPTSQTKLGDMIKNGRRGSLTGKLTIHGIQGHIAYPHLADNPIHCAVHVMSELCHKKWCDGNQDFQATSLQFSNFHSGTGAGNVIPGETEILFNFRYSPEVTANQLQTIVEATLAEHGIQHIIEWTHFGEPYYTPSGKLVEATVEAIRAICGYGPELSTSGGTSDGRYIATTGCDVIELGPSSKTIHQVNECVKVADLEQLAQLYQRILQSLIGQAA